MALGKFKLALKDFEAVKRAKPKDSDAITKYNECNKIVRQKAFAKAIAVETRSAIESVHYETLSKYMITVQVSCLSGSQSVCVN